MDPGVRPNCWRVGISTQVNGRDGGASVQLPFVLFFGTADNSKRSLSAKRKCEDEATTHDEKKEVSATVTRATHARETSSCHFLVGMRRRLYIQRVVRLWLATNCGIMISGRGRNWRKHRPPKGEKMLLRNTPRETHSRGCHLLVLWDAASHKLINVVSPGV
mmetsp:Transcript_27643/g.57840  ORF Transcript_27643/g.57840 Transcript_27643/m.57840 type:complete len:162 (+) Transcript_27643:491-976(+)